MPAPIRSSSLKSGLAISTSDPLASNTIASGAAGNATIAVVTAYTNVGSGDLVSAVSGHTLAARSKIVGGGSTTTTEVSIWYNDNISSGTQTATLTLVNAGTDVTWHFDEYEDLETSGMLDVVSTGSSPTASSSISTGSTATLAQAENLVIAVAANRYNYLWNGGTYGVVPAPAGYTKLQGTYDSALDIPMVSVWDDVSSTAGVSAVFTQVNQSDNGGAAAIAVFQYATGPAAAEIDVGGTIAPISVASATISATPTVFKGSTSSVTVTVLGSDGLPFEGISVALTSGTTSRVTVTSSPQTTNASGVAAFTISGVEVGTSLLTANADSGAATATATAAVSGPTSVALLTIAEPLIVTVGASISVYVRATGTNGLPFPSASVTLASASTGVATVTSSPQTTNSSGIATFSLNGVAAGTSVLTATAASGAVTDTAVASVTTVAPPPTAGTSGSAWARWIR